MQKIIILLFYMYKKILALMLSLTTSFLLYNVLLNRKTIILNYSKKYLPPDEVLKINNKCD